MKYFVGMSGGIDSSVAAVKLKKEGHDVIGAHMILWAEDMQKNKCCNTSDLMFARKVADRYDIPFYTIDFRNVFKEKIVDQAFFQIYREGKTPNPCVSCNRHIRFGALLQNALELGADKVCTGHYALIEKEKGFYRLRAGRDKKKDQSYFLHRLTQEKLARMYFPLGEMLKEEVKQLAEDWGLINSRREKAESQDLCFLPEKSPEPFLKRHLDPLFWKPGNIVTSDRRNVGEHRGLPFYTIGQRKGLDIGGLEEPLYVIGKDMDTNELLVDTSEKGSDTLFLRQLNLIEDHILEGKMYDIRIRYGGKSIKGSVHILSDDESDEAGDLKSARISLHEPVSGICPGQYAVIYDGEYCLGGGEIV